jgi:hypothetical protein
MKLSAVKEKEANVRRYVVNRKKYEPRKGEGKRQTRKEKRTAKS